MSDIPNIEIADIHPEIDAFEMSIINDVWANKYRYGEEKNLKETLSRVADGVYVNDPEYRDTMEAYMHKGLFMPGGRIIAGAGTAKQVTLLNCYVNETVGDSMQGIHKALGNVMFTLQQGGGIGTDFSTLRPRHAELKRTGKGSSASGPIPFMMQWDATSKTVRSAGDRRGAMMGTISDTHPDLLDFIDVKSGSGLLEQMNISVLVSDAFIEAVKKGQKWDLFFSVPPVEARPPELSYRDFVDTDGVYQYIYSSHDAQDIWDAIMRATYVHAEPGVIFIDRVNELNNLYYCEDIRSTNPCGEQPLPPHGACNLGAINLARFVLNPFTAQASINYDLLEEVVSAAVRFLDNVLDVALYPLPEQKEEAINKRRIGLGISGLADVFVQMGVVYGSDESVALVDDIMEIITNETYQQSALLADWRGTFPLYNGEAFLKSDMYSKLFSTTQLLVGHHGMRNGVTMTIAPTGTTSLIFGNISSGLEPTFAHSYNRKIFSSNNEHEAETYEEIASYSLDLYRYFMEEKIAAEDLPGYFKTTQDLDVNAHLNILAVCQKWVDASISKTINIPTEYTFEEFKDVYMDAYDRGCKGCTTYRPNEDSARGTVLEVASSPAAETTVVRAQSIPEQPTTEIKVRPACLEGYTYKMKWPSWNSALYMTINHDEGGKPFEIFLKSKDARHQEWMTAITVMISAIFRRDGYGDWIAEELSALQSVGDGNWIDGKFYGSILSYIGETIASHYDRVCTDDEKEAISAVVELDDIAEGVKGAICPQCQAPSFVMQEGCKKCLSCGYAECG